jgi:hypothetical protein
VSRTLACLTVLLAALPAAAQTANGEPLRLTLHPAALPRQSLKFSLLPGRDEQEPGNAATLYYRSEAMYVDNKPLLLDVKGGAWDTWAEMPLKDMPLDAIRGHLDSAAPVLREVDRAALLRDCDWQLSRRPEGIGLLIPEVQGFRELVRVLAVRARYEIARGRYAEAVAALRSGYALNHRLAAGPTLIHVLVGLAMTAVLDKQLETLVQQPGAPNLYWSLTVLPRPFADLGPALQNETEELEDMWPALKRLDRGPMTTEQLLAFRRDIEKSLNVFNVRRAPAAESLAQWWYDAQAYPEAWRGLREQGYPTAQLEAMPAFQVIALWAYREYRQAWQEYAKWIAVPQFGREKGYREAGRRLQRATERLDQCVLTGGLLVKVGVGPPPYDKVLAAGHRIDRRFAFLRCVEALRLYAANHDGKLPASLDEITEVPVPVEPVTGRPFEYEVKGDTAKLKLPLRPGEQAPPGQTTVYELTMQP